MNIFQAATVIDEVNTNLLVAQQVQFALTEQHRRGAHDGYDNARRECPLCR